MNRTYLRGDMYYADLGRGIGSEQEGYRPVLILQNNTGNKYSPTVIVAAISSKVDAKAKLPTRKTGWNCLLSFFWNSSAPLTRNDWARTSDIWKKSISEKSTTPWRSAWG